MTSSFSSSRHHRPFVAGLPRMLHGGDYNPEQWLHEPAIIDQDLALMPAAGVNEVSVGIFAWAALEPQRGQWDFEWLARLLDRLHAARVGVLLATPMAARPRWLAESHPEVMRTTADGKRASPGVWRHNPCWTAPVLRERAALICERLAQQFGGHPALLGWHIDNEFGGADDHARCYCDGCITGFRSWLQRRYGGDLERLNRAWWSRFWSHQYQSWDQIRPGDGSLEALELNWRRYSSAMVGDFCAMQIAAVRRHSALPVTTNMHGDLCHYDHGALATQLDFTSYDAYHDIEGDRGDRARVHQIAFLVSATRGFGGGKPWLLMESCPSVVQWKPRQRLKRPGVHRALSLSMVGEGSDGVCYFQWRAGRGAMEKLHGAVLMQDAPTDTRIFREVSALGHELQRLSAVVGAATPAQVAIVWDVESEWARVLNSGLNSLPKPQQVAQQWHHSLWSASIAADVVDAGADLSGYQVVVVAGVFLLRPGFSERLLAAAAAGAQVLIDGLSAWVDADFACVAGGRPGPLRAALGLRAEEFDQLRADERLPCSDAQGWLPSGAAVSEWFDRVIPEGCQVLVEADGGFGARSPVVTRNTWDRGGFWYIAGGLEEAARRHLLARLTSEAGIRPCLPELPQGVIARERRQPDRRFVFLASYGDGPSEVVLPPGWCDAVTGSPLASVRLAAWDARVIAAAHETCSPSAPGQ